MRKREYIGRLLPPPKPVDTEPRKYVIISKELHTRVYDEARERGYTIGEFVSLILERALNEA